MGGHALFRRLPADRGDGERGRETLRHGPMKPVGLTNPRTGVKPYAVVQLRQDNALGTLFNMVGFQTKLKHGEQARIFRTIPGLEKAEFAGSAGCTATPSSIRRAARRGCG
jgi:tRNA:m(5)U-54 methyltransferase